MPRHKTKTYESELRRLGQNVRKLRRDRSYTQEQLAEIVDLHPRVLQKIEAGSTNLLVTTAMRLQAALNCQWEEFLPSVKLANPSLKKWNPSHRLVD